MEHWAKKFFERITPQHVENTFGQIGNGFGRFLNFENFSKTFRRLDPQWNSGQNKFLEKITPKHVENTCGHFWERFSAFFEFCKFFDFLKPFRRLDAPWNTGQKKFRKNYPKTCSKHVWTYWERFWTVFEFWKFFDFLKPFRRLDPPWNTAQREISGKSTPKHVQNTFGQFGNNFGRFWKLENFLNLYKDIS